MKNDLRGIYRDQGIRLHIFDGKGRTLRGAYFCDRYGTCVMVMKYLPLEPFVFTMAHELKHHLVDRDLPIACGSDKSDVAIEIGAEVFAAELIFPQELFQEKMAEMSVLPHGCTAEDLVDLKVATRTTLSYASLAKTAIRLGYAVPTAFDGVKWKKLEEKRHGMPLYKQVLAYRRARAVFSGSRFSTTNIR